MPGTAVGIALKAVVLFSGLGSKVSMWLAPPVMNSRMQLLCCGLPLPVCSAARAASVLSQPDAGSPRTPAVESRSHSRRERVELNIATLHIVSPARECNECAAERLTRYTREPAKQF